MPVHLRNNSPYFLSNQYNMSPRRMLLLCMATAAMSWGCDQETASPTLPTLTSHFTLDRYDLSFILDAQASLFSSTQSSYITATASVQNVEFELHADLILDEVSLTEPDGTDLPLSSWQKTGENTYHRGAETELFSRYSIEPADPVLSGSSIVLRVRYHLNPSSVRNSPDNELLKFSVSTRGSRALHPVNGLFPYLGGLVAAPYRIVFTYPADLHGCIPGNLISRDVQSGQIVETYETEVARIPVFSVGPGNRIIREQDGITVEYYLINGQTIPDEVFDQTFASVQLFNKQFGDPGTDSYRIAFVEVAGSSTTGESKGNAIYFAYRPDNPWQWDSESTTDFIRLVNHEMYHNWNIWFVRWEGAFYEWFVEGGAGFMAAWAAEQNLGPDAGRNGRQGFVEGFSANKGYLAPGTLEYAQKGSDTENSLIYSYGALVWEQLRQKLGDSAFQSGLYDFYTQHGYGTADFPALISAFKSHSTVQVEDYLDQWVRHNAQIDLSIDEVNILQQGDQYETTVRVLISSDRDYEIFSEVGWQTSGSGEITYTGIHAIEAGIYEVILTSDAPPAIITLDPLFRVPQTNIGNDIWTQ